MGGGNSSTVGGGLQWRADRVRTARRSRLHPSTHREDDVSTRLTGYRRPDGRWGIRNHVLVLPLHAAANLAADRIAAGIPGAVAVRHAWEAPAGAPHPDRTVPT